MKKLIIVVIGVVVVAAIVISSYAFYQKPKANKINPQFAVENYLPADSIVTLMIDTTNSEQKANIQKIKQTLSKYNYPLSIQALLDKIDDKTINENVNSIIQVVGDNNKIAVALQNINIDPVSSPPQVKMNLIAVSKIQNRAAYDKLFGTLSSKKDSKVKTIANIKVVAKENTVDDAPGNYYLTAKDDYLIFAIAGDDAEFQNILDNANPLSKNADYQKVLSNTAGPYSALVYVNFRSLSSMYDKMIDRVAKSAGESLPASEIEKMRSATASMKILQAMGGTLLAQADGFKFTTYTMGDEKEMDKLKFYFNSVPNAAPYLISQLPGKNSLLYVEVQNLAKALEMSKIMNPAQFTQIEQTLSLAGINMGKDLLPWLDKATALSVRGASGFIPNITLLVDVSSKEDAARSLLSRLDMLLTLGINSNPQLSILGKSTDSKGLTVIKDNSGMLGPLTGAKKAPSLTYGINDQKQLIISLSEDELKLGEDTFAQQDEIKDLLAKLPAKNTGIFYISPATIANTAVGILKNLPMAVPAEQVDQAISYFQPFKHIISSGQTEKYSSKSTGYIVIK